MSRARNYCFTLNNYMEEDEEKLLKNDNFSYIIIGREKGEKGTEHLQGYFQLKEKKALTWIKKHINSRMHVEQAKGSPKQNIEYCTKDNNYKEVGHVKIQGSNTQELYNKIIESKTWNDVLQIEGIERRMKYAQEVFKNKPKERMPEITPRSWQKKILDIIKEEPDDRTIHWIYDEKGGKGKTYLSKYLVSNHGAFYASPMKSSDILYLYNNERIFIYDIPRSVDEEYINYGVLEKVKDGIYTAGKYEGKQAYRNSNVHIIVFSNQDVPHGKFSEDRIHRVIL